MSGGPVQMMAFGYGGELGAEEKIMAELDALQGRGVLRLLDFLFVQKTAEGDLVMLDVGDDEDYGTILAGFFPWDEEDGSPAEAGVDPDELAELAQGLAAGTGMAVVLVEHSWAGGLFTAVEASGGELLSEGFITEEGEVIVGAEVDAISDAADAIEAAHTIEVMARLEALQAISETAAIVQEAAEIRSAAAAEALGALISAGIIEAAAADEAADALAEAGVIATAAEEAEDEAFAQAAEAVAAGREIETAAGYEAAEAVAEADAIAEAAFVQVENAVAEADSAVAAADATTADSALREAEAVEEVEATEELAERLETAATLTKAEKRLLRYLGTDLTFAMISDKLKITRGAVKDRAGRIYRKLRVHSREDAVQAAVELGVLKG